MSEVRVWAPRAAAVRLVTAAPGCLECHDRIEHEMEAVGGGWFTVGAPDAQPGRDYGFSLDGGPIRADPRSRRQPTGVHGPSRFWLDEQPWSDAGWRGRGLVGAVFYELHVGTFTPAGTLDATIERIGHLVELGVTHVELLPLNDFNGEWNWGYDGVLWYAVHEAYGGPDALHRLVDACHNAGLAVCLDVVYNHLGPSGNHLEEFGPYLKEGASTWGPLINLDGEASAGVRAHIVENALMWLGEFHLDALRLDAIHALVDHSPVHLLAELSSRVEELAAALGRPLLLIAESDLNDPVVITERSAGGYGLDGQWDDDVHHALHVALTGERQGYYADFGSLGALAKVLTHGYFHDGTYSSFRGRRHGRPVPRSMPTDRFVAFLQDHDQVGNRAAGDRLGVLVGPELLALGALLLLTSPFTPLLFMGEEWGASTPWPFFTSHPEPELAAKVAEQRAEEFAQHGWNLSRMPDPQDPATFFGAKLRWQEADSGSHAELLDLYRRLLALRREHPELIGGTLDDVSVEVDEDARTVASSRGALSVLVNLGERPAELACSGVELLVATGSVEVLAEVVRLGGCAGAVLRRAGAPPNP